MLNTRRVTMAYTYANFSASILSEGRSRSAKSLISLCQLGRRIVAVWRKRTRDRAELAMLSERDMRDIGADRATVAFEASRRFWQRPLAAWEERGQSRR